MYQHFSFLHPPKFIQIVFFGLTTYHLATVLKCFFLTDAFLKKIEAKQLSHLRRILWLSISAVLYGEKLLTNPEKKENLQ
jgi:hypothetical protein